MRNRAVNLLCKACSSQWIVVPALIVVIFSGSILASRFASLQVEKKSMVVQSFLSMNQGETAGILTDKSKSKLLLKYVNALADAAVNFEFIPHDDIRPFSVVADSVGEGIEIDNFSFDQRNLIITGQAENVEQYEAFLKSVTDSEQFSDIIKNEYVATDDQIQFTIECLADR